jgi:hypothetical protein
MKGLSLLSTFLTFHAGAAMAQDDWTVLTEKILKPPRTAASIEAVFVQDAPRLLAEIQSVKSFPKLTAAWGESSNTDASVKTSIVDPTLLDWILEQTGVPKRRGDVVHAGVQHTLAYLLSNLKTPWGRKRDRWTQEILERGFELPSGILSPRSGSSDGNETPYFYRNISGLLHQLVRWGDPQALAELNSEIRLLPDSLRLSPSQFPFLATRITESVNEDSRKIELLTDLIRFRKPVPFPTARDPQTSLLLYSYRSGGSSPILITAFPIQAGAEEQLLRDREFGSDRPISLRYNMVLADFPKNARGLRVKALRK